MYPILGGTSNFEKLQGNAALHSTFMRKHASFVQNSIHLRNFPMASASGIAMHAVAKASATIAVGAITVTLAVVVSTGRPVVGLIVCPTLLPAISL